jgi:hypothetical protein
MVAVDQKDLTLETADQFGDWHARVGWLFHGDNIAASLAEWVSRR